MNWSINQSNFPVNSHGGRDKTGSCHVTQSEQKKKHGKFFWLNFLKNPLLRHNTQANAHVPLYTAAL